MSYQLDPDIVIRVREIKAQDRMILDDPAFWDKHVTENVTFIENEQIYDKITLAAYKKGIGKDHPMWMIAMINRGYSIITHDGWYAALPREVLVGNK